MADPGFAATIRDVEGAPSVPAEAREDLLALKSGAQFVCTRPDGSIRPARASGEGYYAQDTRHLSELRLMVGGLPTVPLSSVMESGHHAVINATNPVLGRDGASVPQDTLNVRRTVLVADRLYYRVRVRNFHTQPVATVVEMSLAADFADVFEVRGVGRRTGGQLAPPTREGDRLRFSYLAVDGRRRETLVDLSPTPGRVRIDGNRVHVAWDLRLDAGEAIELQLTVLPIMRGRRSRRTDARAGRDAARGDPCRLGRRLRAHQHRQRAVRPADRRVGARPARADDAARRATRYRPPAFRGMSRRSAATRC